MVTQVHDAVQVIHEGDVTGGVAGGVQHAHRVAGDIQVLPVDEKSVGRELLPPATPAEGLLYLRLTIGGHPPAFNVSANLGFGGGSAKFADAELLGLMDSHRCTRRGAQARGHAQMIGVKVGHGDGGNIRHRMAEQAQSFCAAVPVLVRIPARIDDVHAAGGVQQQVAEGIVGEGARLGQAVTEQAIPHLLQLGNALTCCGGELGGAGGLHLFDRSPGARVADDADTEP